MSMSQLAEDEIMMNSFNSSSLKGNAHFICITPMHEKERNLPSSFYIVCLPPVINFVKESIRKF